MTATSRAGTLVDGVLFDIDDTIVDTRAAFAHALTAVAEAYLPPLPAASAAERHRAVVAMWRADVNGHYRRYTAGEDTYVHQRHQRANELHAAFGGPELDDAAFVAWDEVFDGGFRAAWAAHDETEDVLTALLDAGVVVGALSNAATAYQSAKLEKAGLLDRVPMLVGVDTLGFGKPDPRVFLEACRRLGTDPARTAYVGDEADIDALAARDAGLVGVWLDRPGARRVVVDVDAVRGVHVISSLDELPAALGL
ncbi:HAD family hydrolase [Cellulomonas composti]|uniref:Haloacid dehalogenase n=1 Tax=Cellulomonas composti TaxID=266130 RepID=A0A511JCP3_9CELL|nr:HAD family hydrolase [Cellulomonas composti]GEL95483.1 haloacid dehalogenase [Cellulomonas composti]